MNHYKIKSIQSLPQIQAFRDKDGFITGWVVHKVVHNGYKFSLWYNSNSELVDLEKFTGDTDRAVFGRSVRIGQADRNYFRIFNRIRTGVSLTEILPYHLAK